MRDEIDGRLWTEHHEMFSEQISQALTRLRGIFQRSVNNPSCEDETLQLPAE
ncbi:MAG: hypothetical protein H0W74_07760 [Sphingosinicella sp.]|nr:hypothetical protein [Sphingosinicella sp.]